MVYMGSKNRIAKYLLPFITKYLTEDKWYVEPFCGGCNMIDKVKHPKRIANDYNKYLIALFKAIQEGVELPDFISREEYYIVKENKDEYEDWYVGFVGFICSTRGKFFDCYNGIREVSGGKKRNYISECRNNILKQIHNLEDCIFTNESYLDIAFKAPCVIYCDPPYSNTKKYKYSINADVFWQWCRDTTKSGNHVLISEYDAPSDFICIWKKEICSSIGTGGRVKSIEKLFVHESIADKYLERNLFD